MSKLNKNCDVYLYKGDNKVEIYPVYEINYKFKYITLSYILFKISDKMPTIYN